MQTCPFFYLDCSDQGFDRVHSASRKPPIYNISMHSLCLKIDSYIESLKENIPEELFFNQHNNFHHQHSLIALKDDFLSGREDNLLGHGSLLNRLSKTEVKVMFLNSFTFTCRIGSTE